jgi:hypothetical protein
VLFQRVVGVLFLPKSARFFYTIRLVWTKTHARYDQDKYLPSKVQPITINIYLSKLFLWICGAQRGVLSRKALNWFSTVVGSVSQFFLSIRILSHFLYETVVGFGLCSVRANVSYFDIQYHLYEQ